MPRYYYRRRWTPRYRRRYRWFRTWRTRKAFRKRHRRRHRVRRKLKSLPLKQWQPKYINKLTVKGLYCLFQVHRTRYNHDFNAYEISIPKEGLSNGGGFSINRFTLSALFEQHEKAHNVWSKSNKYMPLFRYTGVTVKIYRPLYVDLLVKFQTCYPMCCTKLLYTGSQPSIMMMTKGCKIIRCKKNAPNAKPYKKYRLPPPEQMLNKWYFQQKEANTGLLLVQSSAASLDQYYTSIHADSSLITLHTLNTKIFKNLNFVETPTYGYMPHSKMALWAVGGGEEKIQDLIYLGQSKMYNSGYPLSKEKKDTFANTLNNYMKHPEWWGNVFHHTNLYQTHDIYFTQQQPNIAFQNKLTTIQLTDNISQHSDIIHKFTQEFMFPIRYNPFEDKGYENNIYIRANFKDNNEDLEPEEDIDLQNPGFPNWLSVFGFQDYLIKLAKKSQINTHYIMIHKSKYFHPKLDYYIFMDNYFLNANSEELEGRTDFDNIHWYPYITHQQGALNTLALCGPGAPKLGEIKLAEAKMEYIFHFKIGGCAPNVQKINNPADQPTYATPSNILDTNSLQSPTAPLETFLYQFDWRRDQITETAAKRISKDYTTEKSLFTDATTTGTAVPFYKTHEKDLLSSEEEETQTETLYDQLQFQRNKQKQLRYRIKQLLSQIQELE